MHKAFLLFSALAVAAVAFALPARAEDAATAPPSATAREIAEKKWTAKSPETLVRNLLEGKDPYLRSQAAEDLGKRGDKSRPVIEALMRGLLDPDRLVRVSSGYALCELAGHDEIQMLLDLLGHEEYEVREHANQALKARTLLYNGEVHTKEETAQTTKKWNKWWEENKAVVEIPVLALDPYPPFEPDRRRSIHVLMEKNVAIAVTVLKRSCSSPDPEERTHASIVLGSLGDKTALEPLLKALKDDKPEVRWGAALGLGLLKHPKAIPHLIEGLKDESDGKVREASLLALMAIARDFMEESPRFFAVEEFKNPRRFVERLRQEGLAPFTAADLRNPVVLARALRRPEDPLSLYLAGKLQPGTKELLEKWDGASVPGAEIQGALLSELNLRLDDEALHAEDRFVAATLGKDTLELLDLKKAAAAPAEGGLGKRLNRMLLEDSYSSLGVRDRLTPWLKSRLSGETKGLLAGHDPQRPPSETLLKSLLKDLNAAIQPPRPEGSFDKLKTAEERRAFIEKRLSYLIYDDQRFSHVKLTQGTRRLLDRGLDGEDLAYLNRLLLEEAFPDEISWIQKQKEESFKFQWSHYADRRVDPVAEWSGWWQAHENDPKIKYYGLFEVFE